MKNLLIVSLIALFFISCEKDNTLGPAPNPDPDPETVYKTEITINFVIPAGVQLLGGDNMWVLRSDEEQITNRIQTEFPTMVIVLTGDSVKNNMHKKCYIFGRFAKRIESLNYSYDFRKSFTMEEKVTITLTVSADRLAEEHFDP